MALPSLLKRKAPGSNSTVGKNFYFVILARLAFLTALGSPIIIIVLDDPHHIKCSNKGVLNIIIPFSYVLHTITQNIFEQYKAYIT